MIPDSNKLHSATMNEREGSFTRPWTNRSPRNSALPDARTLAESTLKSPGKHIVKRSPFYGAILEADTVRLCWLGNAAHLCQIVRRLRRSPV